MPKWSKKKKVVRASVGRRRLGGPGSGRRAGGAFARTAMVLAPRIAEGVTRVRARVAGRRYYSKPARRVLASANLSVGDNITTLPTTVIGKPRKPTFAEKVARVERPPLLFKRNFQFSVECLGGRKAWFNIGLNHSTNDLVVDTQTYGTNLLTDTAYVDPTATAPGQADRFKFYIDYMNTKLQFMNSGTNALIGKIHLFAYKRDCKTHYMTTTPINPVNLMMYYSNNARAQQPPNYENDISGGWKFDTSTANYNYTANYNMPGSSLNSAGVCAFTDLALSPLSSHIKADMGFWFRPVATQSFNLKPGQQCNKVIKFHDLAQLYREQMDSEFFAGVSYAIAVEFQGQIVGSIATANLVSTGSAQLSIIREDIRILGQKNVLKPKVLLQTNPLTTILKADQTIINPDSGTVLNGFSDDA